jgi:hypothetical protein
VAPQLKRDPLGGRTTTLTPSMHCHRSALIWVFTAWAGPQAMAQSPSPERALPVAGTLIYNLLLLSGPPDSHAGGVGARFGGRLAVRVALRTYVGMGVGSWVQAQTGRCAAPVECGTFADYWSEAIVYQVYAQHTPSMEFPAWVRLGAGIANTSTLAPGGGVIEVADRWRAAVSGGVGADLPVSGHLFVTPSIDYTTLRGVVGRSQELRHAFALGLGVTFR